MAAGDQVFCLRAAQFEQNNTCNDSAPNISGTPGTRDALTDATNEHFEATTTATEDGRQPPAATNDHNTLLSNHTMTD